MQINQGLPFQLTAETLAYCVPTVRRMLHRQMVQVEHLTQAFLVDKPTSFETLKKAQPLFTPNKIKWTYLKNNNMGLDTMALKGYDDPEPIEKFVEQYIDHDKVFKSAFANKLNDFYGAIKWGKVPENNNLGKFFAFG